MNKNKGDYMINLKNVGLTALAGSLVAASATAGELSVTGAAQVSYTTGKNGSNSANAIGTDKDVKFSGSGELDNGWTFAIHTLTKDDIGTVSSTATSITMGSMGTIGFGTGGGTNINGAYDEPIPTAYEEVSDGGQGQSTPNHVGNWADDSAIVYSLPAMEMMGATVNMGVEYSLNAGVATANDGGTAARSDTYGNAYGVGITVAYDALTLGVYGAERDNKNPTTVADVSDEFNGSWFAKYSFGPVTIGYSQFYVDAGLTEHTNDNTTTNAKTVGTSGGIFDGDAMSIAFNVNDNLSISYGENKETFDSRDHNKSGTSTADVEQTTDALQVAYSMGGMSIKAYTTETKNPNFVDGSRSLKSNEITLGLAF